MNAKTRNKIATAGIYTLVSIVVIILFGILGDILVSGVHIFHGIFYLLKPLLIKLVVE